MSDPFSEYLELKHREEQDERDAIERKAWQKKEARLKKKADKSVVLCIKNLRKLIVEARSSGQKPGPIYEDMLSAIANKSLGIMLWSDKKNRRK